MIKIQNIQVGLVESVRFSNMTPVRRSAGSYPLFWRILEENYPFKTNVLRISAKLIHVKGKSTEKGLFLTRGGGGTIHILGMGTCHREGYRFSQFWYSNGINFRNFHNWYSVGYAFSKNWYKVGYTLRKNWYKERVCF